MSLYLVLINGVLWFSSNVISIKLIEFDTITRNGCQIISNLCKLINIVTLNNVNLVLNCWYFHFLIDCGLNVVLLYVAKQCLIKINVNVSTILTFNLIYATEIPIHNILSGAACEAIVEQNCDNNINSSNDTQLMTTSTDYAILCNSKMNLIENRSPERWESNTSYSDNDNLRAISYNDLATYGIGNNIKIHPTIVPNIKEFEKPDMYVNKYYVLIGLFLSGLCW